MDIEKLCRLCATENNTLYPIFTNSLCDEIDLPTKIQTFAPVNISEDDGLPTMLCSNCRDKLDASFNFRQQIMVAYDKLKDIVKARLETYHKPEVIKVETMDLDQSDGNQSDSEWNDFEWNGSKKNLKKLHPRKSELCHVCGKVFSINSYADHLLTVHNESAKVRCDICGFNVKTKRLLWHHKKIKHGNNVVCKICQKSYSNNFTLKIHVKNVHLGIKNHKCTFCDYSAFKKTQLTHHMRTHTGERPYICSRCNAAFSKSWTLKQHMRLHTNEKPYKCELCDEAFRQNVVLKAHINKKHS